ncbi:hypothetical protein TURU_000586 [Turdus rufiventris]|nr:hypothetical protein TURU_000586 [Turdus rufiventris]
MPTQAVQLSHRTAFTAYLRSASFSFLVSARYAGCSSSEKGDKDLIHSVPTAQLQCLECTRKYSLSTFIIEGDKGQKLVHLYYGKD